jgi:kynurenine formamidase
MRAPGCLYGVAVLALLTGACGQTQTGSERDRLFPDGALVDLSHAYDEQTVFWPTSDRFRLEKVADGVTEGGWYYAANNFFTSEHGGTHLDAPVHFAAGRPAVDRIPLDRLVAPIVRVDVSAKCRDDADYQVTVQDLLDSERTDGPITPDSILLLHTGFATRWPDAARYLGTADRGEAAVAKLHFPGLHPDAARWLVANRPVRAVGLDTASIDYGQSTKYESHRVLFERDIPAFENLTSLDQIPPRGAFMVALPMKIKDGSGAPLRAIAIVPRSR